MQSLVTGQHSAAEMLSVKHGVCKETLKDCKPPAPRPAEKSEDVCFAVFVTQFSVSRHLRAPLSL